MDIYAKIEVCINFSHIYECIQRPLGLYLNVFVKGLSVELDPHRGVVNRLWFMPRWSNCPLVLCRASQEAVLRRTSGSFGCLCQLWPVEALKVWQKLAVFRPSEVGV